MASTSSTLKYSNKLFIDLSVAPDYCLTFLNLHLSSSEVQNLVDLKLLPVFTYGSDSVVLIEDIKSVISILQNSPVSSSPYVSTGALWSDIPAALRTSPNTQIDLSGKLTDIDPTFFSAVRNLTSVIESSGHDDASDLRAMSYFTPTLITTSSKATLALAEKQLNRAKLINSADTSQFANSAYYMGTKRALRGYLIESLSSTLSADAVVVDLMCGSGSASSAFSRFWRTYASDLQTFCQHLAVVQGGGFSVKAAQDLLSFLLPFAGQNAEALEGVLAEPLSTEDVLFHSGITAEVLHDYQRFIEMFPTYPAEGNWDNWNPSGEVQKRQIDSREFPFCLFTCYFANTYFGLRQAIEVDSLRYAIEKINDEKCKQWALGALIATLSALGSTFGGHFAQPRFRNSKDYRIENLSRVLELRSLSVMHEFSVRLIKLAEASESCVYPVITLDGPWQKALTELDKILPKASSEVLVYVDAPYKRDEYSRYYHVLETVVRYSYPSSTGVGRVPEKGTDSRPTSEFFTRVTSRMNDALVNVLTGILKRGWICAWSYADSGDANILEVLMETNNQININARSYAVPYEHKSQGGFRAKPVTEYLLLLSVRE